MKLASRSQGLFPKLIELFISGIKKGRRQFTQNVVLFCLKILCSEKNVNISILILIISGDKRMQENSKKHTTDSASSGRNRKDNSQRSNRKSTGGGTESPISGKGDKNASASNTATKSKHLTSTAKTGLAMSNGCESSSSSGIGSSSSRLSSSGGSSDAVDTCDTNTTTSAVTPSNHHTQEAPRVPELHPEHGLQLEAGRS